MQKNYRIQSQSQSSKDEDKNVGISCSILRWKIKESSQGKEKITQPSKQDKSTVHSCIPKFPGKTQPRTIQPSPRINTGTVYNCTPKFSGKTQSNSKQDSSSSRFAPKKIVRDYIQNFFGKTQSSKHPCAEPGTMKINEQIPASETGTTSSRTISVNTQEKGKAQTATTSSTQHTSQPKETQKAQPSNKEHKYHCLDEYDNHIFWKDIQEPKIEWRCCLCEGELTYEGTAVLCCGHVFHNTCFQFATFGDKSNDPSCIICTQF